MAFGRPRGCFHGCFSLCGAFGFFLHRNHDRNRNLQQNFQMSKTRGILVLLLCLLCIPVNVNRALHVRYPRVSKSRSVAISSSLPEVQFAEGWAARGEDHAISGNTSLVQVQPLQFLQIGKKRTRRPRWLYSTGAGPRGEECPGKRQCLPLRSRCPIAQGHAVAETFHRRRPLPHPRTRLQALGDSALTSEECA